MKRKMQIHGSPVSREYYSQIVVNIMEEKYSKYINRLSEWIKKSWIKEIKTYEDEELKRLLLKEFDTWDIRSRIVLEARFKK